MSKFSNTFCSCIKRSLLEVVAKCAHGAKGAFLLLAALLVLIAPPLQAQQQTAQLTGQITDSSGAVIAGATVTVTNAARGIKALATSDATGGYVVPLLPPADGYQLTVSKEGFSAATRNGITLQVAQVAKVGSQLIRCVASRLDSVTRALAVAASAH